jgi:hypothetical protein
MKRILLILALTFAASASQANCTDALNVVGSTLDNITDLANSCPGASEDLKREYRRLGRKNIDLLVRAARICQRECRGTLQDAVQFCSEVEQDAPSMGAQLDAKCR